MTTTTLNALPLALAFAKHLREAMTNEEMATILERNGTKEYATACASHDFCDANMLMAAAFVATFEREPFTTIDVESGEASEATLKADTDVWNQAWDWAKAGRFDNELITQVADDEVLDRATNDALDEAARQIQDHLGVTTGDFAGLYFTGSTFDQFKALLRQYLEAQRIDHEDNVEDGEEA